MVGYALSTKNSQGGEALKEPTKMLETLAKSLPPVGELYEHPTFFSSLTIPQAGTFSVIIMPPPLRLGALSDDARLMSVCLTSVCRVHRPQVENKKEAAD